MNHDKKPLKLHIRFEFAYEIIYISIFIILVGLGFLFASNLLIFNWFTVFFGVLAIIFIYLKHQSYLTIENDVLTTVYLHFYTKEKIQMITVSEFVFYEDSRLVEVKSSDRVIGKIYLSEKNKRKFLNYIVNHYPEIPCLFMS